MADPPAAAIDWSGFYAGVQLGGGLDRVDVNDPFGASLYGDTVRTPGTLGGFQAGYNWQWDAFLLGIETDVDLASMSGTNTCLAFSGYYVGANCQAGVDALGSLTGRLGVAFGPAGSTLLYGKAGLAWMYGNLDVTPNGGFGLPGIEQHGTEWGYTLGAGAEQAVDPNRSVRAEYDFLSFANAGVGAPASLISPAPNVVVGSAGAASHFSQRRPDAQGRTQLPLWRRRRPAADGAGRRPSATRARDRGLRPLRGRLGAVPKGPRHP
jgi:opacity protein-like surface antigen